MKYLILIGLIYGIYRVSNISKKIASGKKDQINQEQDSGFSDYEEVE